jgi:hypothetical protein
MSQQNGFGNGFVLGSLVGGVVGGVLGTVLATRKEKQISKTDYQLQTGQEMPFSTEESIELARHGLEDKIAQLNLAIDDVRQQLGTVKASSEQD